MTTRLHYAKMKPRKGNHMNYERAYTNIILRAKKRDEADPTWAEGTYTENHHWYPKSVYPEYATADWNIVCLTAKEHYIVHYLLHKMRPDCRKMSYAFWCMSAMDPASGKRHVPNGRSFEVARKALTDAQTGRTHSEATKSKMSAAHKGKTLSDEHKAKLSKSKSGENNPHYGKTLSDATKSKMSKAKSGANNHKARITNVYCHKSGELIAEGVILRAWCRENGYDHGNLSTTTRADRNKPSTATNPLHTKGVYAQYV